MQLDWQAAEPQGQDIIMDGGPGQPLEWQGAELAAMAAGWGNNEIDRCIIQAHHKHVGYTNDEEMEWLHIPEGWPNAGMLELAGTSSVAHTPTELVSDEEDTVGNGVEQVRSATAPRAIGSVAQEAAATVPGAEMQCSSVRIEGVTCDKAGGDASSTTANAAAPNSEINGAPGAVSGAPGQGEGDLDHARHPDALMFSNAIWACLGDPNEALAAVGGG